MRINSATKEVICKVVYYGPGMSGKTTNLKVVHERAPRQSIGELVTIDTHSERTLHFDLLPMDLGQIHGFKIRFEFFTVPGQSYYAATRRLVLEGADGVVFVADSRREALDENIDSMNDLLDNLRHHQLPEDLPVVIQYNKQDLPTALKPEQLDPLLNIRHWPRFTAVAPNGEGVLDTLKAISGLVVERLNREQALLAPGATPVETPVSRTWLITCYRCHNMLEISNAKKGDLFTCGACGTALEIAEIEHGLTKAPQQPSAHAQANAAPNVAPAEPSNYAMQSLEDPSGALKIPNTGSSAGRSSIPMEAASFELDGFDQLATLDESLQGRRYRIRERATGTRYRALVLGQQLVRQPGYLPQIEPYARLASQVKHAHILPMTSLRQGRDTPILLSVDPPDHESLTHVLARRRTLAPPHALGIARQLALALEEASRQGVIHGWLRPEVILLSAEGGVLLDELGLVKNHRYLLRELNGASAATEYYLAPEHLSDEARSDVRSDIFMLGALVFRMITGEGLVTGYNAHEALHKIVANGPRTMRMVQPSISRDLDNFFSRMVCAERKDRFQSYREFIDTLDKFGGGAKRATLRLTGPTAGGTSRTNTKLPTRGTASGKRSPANPGSGGYPRSVNTEQQLASGARRVREETSEGLVWLVVAIVLVVLAGLAFLAINDSSSGKIMAGKPTEGAPILSVNNKAGNPSTPPKTPPPMTPPSNTGTAATTPVKPVNSSKTTPIEPNNVAKEPKNPDVNAVGAGDAKRGDIMFSIAKLERAEEFKAALDVCEQLTGDDKAARQQEVTLKHDNRKKEVEDAVAKAASIDEVQKLLAPAQKSWGMPGDDTWAQDLLAAARARLPVAKEQPKGEEPTTKETPVETPAPTVDSAAAEDAAWASDQALLRGQAINAEQALISLPPNSPAFGAIRRKIDIWRNRAEILAPAITERKQTLRLLHPTDNTLWDVTAIDNAGIQVMSPSGTGTHLEWTKIDPKVVAHVCYEAASHKDAKPREHALATVMLSLAGETSLASVELMRHKKTLDEDVVRDLETMLTLRRTRETAELLKQANDAIAAKDGKTLGDLIDQLKRTDRVNLPQVAAALPVLEAAEKKLSDKSAGSEGGRDSLSFDSSDDLRAFSSKEGSWQVANGQLTSSSDRATLTRKDLANAKGLSLTFQASSNKGSLAVNFRGARVLVDLAHNVVTVSSRDAEIKPKEFSFVAKTVYSLYLESRPGLGQISVELNNGAEIFDLKCGQLTDQMTIGIDNGAPVAFDDIVITRETGKTVVRPQDAAADAARLEKVRNLGFEPLGAVYLDPPALVLPAVGGAPRSGIGIALRESIASVNFEIKGSGKLRVQIGKLGVAEGEWVDLDLPADGNTALKFSVSWTGGIFSIKNDDGASIHEGKITGAPTHLLVTALNEATILSTPKLNRQ